MRTVIQTAWDIAQGVLTASPTSKSPYLHEPFFTPKPATSAENPYNWDSGAIDEGWIFAHGWIDRIKACFAEYKVHKITAHYLPYAPATAMGEYCFTLWDDGENATPSSFVSSIGVPASVVRKLSQPAKLVWYPTEPDDRNWHAFGDKHHWCRSTVYSAESIYQSEPDVEVTNTKVYKETANIAGKIIIEADVSARGKPTGPGVFAPYGSVEYGEWQDRVRCCCTRCTRRLTRQLLLRLQHVETDLGNQTPSLSSPIEHLSME